MFSFECARSFAQLKRDSVAMSAVPYYELYFGALNNQRVEHNLLTLRALVERVPTITLVDGCRG
jgi:predicted nucleic acid-binding protein